MKYEHPTHSTPDEIIDTLKRTDISPSARIKVVLSAVFYDGDVEFSGDVLINEFSQAEYKERLHLKNVFETFYGMRRTTYRIDDSIRLLREYQEEDTENCLEIGSTIDGLLEYKTMFGSHPQ